jgi:arylformamidase
MAIYDISLPINESLVVWPGDPPVQITQPLHLARGDAATVSRICMGAHTGTHVDAPAHFLVDGSGVDSLDLDLLLGVALVVEALGSGDLTAGVLERLDIPPGTERVLFKTQSSERRARGMMEFDTELPGITESGADWIVAHGIGLVGVDSLSVAPFGRESATHLALLKAGVILLEGLDLGAVSQGSYMLVCLPLRITGLDGAPARAILIGENR